MPVIIHWARRLYTVHDVHFDENLDDVIRRMHPLLPPVDALFFCRDGKRIMSDDPLMCVDDEIIARLRPHALSRTIGPLYCDAISQLHNPSERATMLERAEEAAAEVAHRLDTGWRQARPPFGTSTEAMLDAAEVAFIGGMRLPMLDAVLEPYALLRLSSGAGTSSIARLVHRRTLACVTDLSVRERITHAAKACISTGSAGPEVNCIAFASSLQQFITESDAAAVYRSIIHVHAETDADTSDTDMEADNTDAGNDTDGFIADVFAPMHVLTTDAIIGDMEGRIYDGNDDEDAPQLDGIAVDVDRDNVLASTFDQIMMLTPDNVRVGSVVDVVYMQETGVGAGVMRDWMVHAWRDLADPARGFFCTSPVHPHVLHPNPEGETWQPGEFLVSMEFAGRMAGIAIRANAPTGFHLSRAMYRCMTQDPSVVTNLSDRMLDLAELQPDVARSCTAILGAGDQAELDAMTIPGFAVTDDVSLLPGVSALDAANVDVTMANRYLFVRLVADHYTGVRGNCRHAASALMRGLCFATGNDEVSTGDMAFIMSSRVSHSKFNDVCGGEVCVPVEELLRRTRVTFSDADGAGQQAAVTLFWEAVRRMTHEERRGLLRLWTGATSLATMSPLYGSGTTMEVVFVEDDDTRRLPSSHTCYMQLVMPCCADLARRLHMAIDYSSNTAIED